MTDRSNTKKSKGKSLEEKMEQVYQKKTQREHVYDLPDTYIGSIISNTGPMWVYSDESETIELREITYNPGLFKIYDEPISNTYDQHKRDKTCKTIKVNFDKKSGMIKIYNDGNGIPVVVHPEHKVYIPELIFGHMLTGSSYSENDSEVTGRNGIGVKCTNIFSKKFILETVYVNKKEKIYKKYVQEFTDNMLNIGTPVITDVSENTETYTEITFYPDYEKFGMKGMTDDILALFKKRVYDMSVCTDKRVSVYLDNKKIKVKLFEDFIKMHYLQTPKVVYEEVNEKWRVGVVFDPDNGGNQVSFVNSNWTFIGGTHVEYIANQITKKVIDYIKSKKDGKSLVIKPAQIREHLTFFIDCNIVKPSFSSQTKGEMTKKSVDFGSSCELSQGFIKKIIDSGLAELVTKLAMSRANAGLKTTDGKRVSSIKDIPKLHDAHLAGTRRSKECSLILTEGDSALSFAISGMSVLGRDKFGAFPLKGKLLNVRNATAAQIKKNQEFIYLKRILGLKQDVKYNDVSKLRYGKIIVLTDQDSVSGDTPLLLKHRKNIIIKTINDLSTDWIETEDGKETSRTNFKVWTDKGWTDIVRIIKHRVNKRMYRVYTKSGVVDVTEDHSLLKSDSEEISPKECKVNDELLHSYPIFDQTLTEQINDELSTHVEKLGNSETNEKDAYLMGVYFSNNIYEENCWKFVNNDPYILMDVSDMLKKYYGYESHYNAGESDYYMLTVFESENSSEYFDKYRNIFTDGNSNRIIPMEILNGSLESRRKFFNGMCNIEYSGKISENYTRKIYPSSKIEAHCIYLLCKSIGLEVTLCDYFNKLELNISVKKQYENSTKITKIIDLGICSTEVYDLETENHHFQAGVGSMIVHNTDGSHIKGLVINMFQHFWPELLQIDGFIQTMSTPLVKVWRKTDATKKNPVEFFTLTSYEEWVENEIKNGTISKWTKPKYYKGLGTSSEKEAREVFSDFENRIVSYVWEKYDVNGNEIISNEKKSKSNKNKNEDNEKLESDNENYSDDETEEENDSDKSESNKNLIYNSKSYDRILLAFDASRSDHRKTWLNSHNKHDVLEYDKQFVTYSEFIDKDLINFSKLDNERSIPSMIDSFKPSHRKILFAIIKKNQKGEIKVAQLASYVAEKTAYKHGEKSMEESIVGMAQRFTGSNNVPVLHPCGNFGSRRDGGNDHASPRYIFTYLDPITRKIFIEEDECILKYQEDEGDMIEPEYYCPIIPMILVNGAKGIGTGWSSEVPHFNMIDICKNLIRKLDGKEMKQIHPWYYGFKGTIEEEEKLKYKISGKFEIIDMDTVRITELPIKGNLCWTSDYCEYLKTLLYDEKTNKTGKIYDLNDNSGNNEICIDVIFKSGELQTLIKKSSDGKEEIEKYLKLTSRISMTNMWLYNAEGIITKYNTPLEILEEFYHFRLKMYGERKKHHLKLLNNELEILRNKVRFINDVLNKKIVLDNKLKSKIIAEIKKFGYPKLSNKLDALDPPNDDDDDIEEKVDKNENDDVDVDLKKGKGITYKSYSYITSMQLFSLTKDKVDELTETLKQKEKEVNDYNSTSEKDFWRRELNALMEYYPQWITDRENEEADDEIEGKKKKNKKDKKNNEDKKQIKKIKSSKNDEKNKSKKFKI